MRPSISVSFEPGLERGVPWGRDLYTFVTSAAGHMMRTLQKPRKSRPSKRQVNHRRFLHNMIQRKFADIEAANHRLASALYVKDGVKSTLPPLLENQENLNSSDLPSPNEALQSVNVINVQTDAGRVSKSREDTSAGSYGHEVLDKKHSDPADLQNCLFKSTSSSATNKQNRKKTEEDKVGAVIESHKEGAGTFQSEYHHDTVPSQLIKDHMETTSGPLSNSSAPPFAQDENNSPSFGSDLLSLGLDSISDFSVHMFTDLFSCSQAQPSDITEAAVGAQHSEGCVDAEVFFEQDNAVFDACGEDDVTFGDISEDFVEGLSTEGGECGYVHSFGSPGESASLFQDDQMSSYLLRGTDADEEHTNDVKSSISYSPSPTQRQSQLQMRSYYLTLSNLNLGLFEGVAQSFSAPPLHHEQCPIPAIPHEEDYLFTDILQDGQ